MQILIACIYCLLAAGVVFGFAAFKPVLIKEGVYSELCTENDPSDRKQACIAQEIRCVDLSRPRLLAYPIRLNLMFTTAAVVTNVAALPVGTILDKYGPRVCGLLGSLFLALGSAFVTVAPAFPLDGYLLGYLFLALGGPFIYIPSFQLSNCFPRHSGLILALLTGAFDTSSAVLLIYRLCYDASGETFTPQTFFAIYLIVPLFIFLAQFLVMPAQSYKTMGEIVQEAEDSADGIVSLASGFNEHDRQAIIEDRRKQRRESVLDEMTPLMGKKDQVKAQEQEDRKKRISGVWGALHGFTALQQIATPWWVLIALFTTFQMTRINYFVATIRTQYIYLFGSYEKALKVNNVFDVSLPAGGIVAIPFIGLILDNLSTPVTLGILVGTATLIGIMGVLPYMWAAYVNVVLFTLYRPFYYTGISDYTAKVFGFHTFGKVYGLIICVAGLFNFVQSGLDTLTHGSFQDDPRPVNAILLSVTFIIGTTLVIYVQSQKRQMQRERLEEEIDGATERLMPT